MPFQIDTIVRAAAIGVVAGMRSQLPLALLSVATQQRDQSGRGLPDVLASPKVTALLLAAAAGELVVDKLPFTPSRLMPGSLVVRTTVGGLAGALLARSGGMHPIYGAAPGAWGALAGSYAGHDARAGLVAATGAPDPLIAVLEDVTAVALGCYAVGLTSGPGLADATR